MTYTYIPKGICAQRIDLELDGNVIKKVVFTGGCNGNLKGISSLVVGMTAEQVIERVKGTTCGYKMTSCPDQLSRALEAAMEIVNKQS